VVEGEVMPPEGSKASPSDNKAKKGTEEENFDPLAFLEGLDELKESKEEEKEAAPDDPFTFLLPEEERRRREEEAKANEEKAASEATEEEKKPKEPVFNTVITHRVKNLQASRKKLIPIAKTIAGKNYYAAHRANFDINKKICVKISQALKDAAHALERKCGSADRSLFVVEEAWAGRAFF